VRAPNLISRDTIGPVLNVYIMSRVRCVSGIDAKEDLGDTAGFRDGNTNKRFLSLSHFLFKTL